MNDDNDYPFNKRKILKFNYIKFNNNNNNIKSNIKLIQVIRHQVLAQLQSQLINHYKCCYYQKLKTKSSLNQVKSSLKLSLSAEICAQRE